jgi:hypothetical protein
MHRTEERPMDTRTFRAGRAAASALLLGVALTLGPAAPADAQLVDGTTAVNTLGEGVRKSLAQQVGAGRGDAFTPYSSTFVIQRDPFRAIRRGRQLFQRKFTFAQGQGPVMGDGAGDLDTVLSIGAGLADSCALCHGRPRGSAGFGGDVATRPDSRDAPHLFGLGLQEMLADEITADLRAIRRRALAAAAARRRPVRVALRTPKGIHYGFVTARPDGTVDTSEVRGVDPDLRVRPFFAEGSTISIREFVVGALKFEMGLDADDPELLAASEGARLVTPAGMVLDGARDRIEIPGPDPSGVKEIPTALVDYLEFYLLNYFKPALYRQTPATREGRASFERIGCAQCHVPDLRIERDRRVADVETVHDPARGHFNDLFATATALFVETDDGSGHPSLKRPRGEPFLVENVFTDFKRHDLGPAFWERNYDGTVRTEFMTEPLWGVGSTAPYGHDGRSINLTEVILRHGGEAAPARDAFAALSSRGRHAVLEFLSSLVLFPPDDTASNLDPGDPNAPGFPQAGHGSIALRVLFDDPTDVE